jgi:hypothetical protein
MRSRVSTVGFDTAKELSRYAESWRRAAFQRWLHENTLDDNDIDDAPECRAATHGRRNSTCTCEESGE